MNKPTLSLKEKIHEIIFEADTPSGKAFDIALLVLIVLSIVAVMLESVEAINVEYHRILVVVEWVLTVLFTIEYVTRLYSIKQPVKYATSFFGVIDLLAIIPTYLSLVFSGSHYFLVIRALRLLRAFRVLKLARFVGESNSLLQAMKHSRPKITVFLFAVSIIVIILGSAMYLIESGANSGFSSIPKSVYWAIVTLTTVGYGDITPVTTLGQFVSVVLMITGYSIIAVPTGIVTAELTQAKSKEVIINTQSCQNCGEEGHDGDAEFCKYCGSKL